MYVETAKVSPYLWLPSGPALISPTWTKARALEARWDPVLIWFAELRQRRLTAVMITMDFFRHRLAPLQALI